MPSFSETLLNQQKPNFLKGLKVEATKSYETPFNTFYMDLECKPTYKFEQSIIDKLKLLKTNMKILESDYKLKDSEKYTHENSKEDIKQILYSIDIEGFESESSGTKKKISVYHIQDRGNDSVQTQFDSSSEDKTLDYYSCSGSIDVNRWIKVYTADRFQINNRNLPKNGYNVFKDAFEAKFLIEVYYQNLAYSLNNDCDFFSPEIYDYGMIHNIDGVWYFYIIMEKLDIKNYHQMTQDDCGKYKEIILSINKCLTKYNLHHRDIAFRNIYISNYDKRHYIIDFDSAGPVDDVATWTSWDKTDIGFCGDTKGGYKRSRKIKYKLNLSTKRKHNKHSLKRRHQNKNNK